MKNARAFWLFGLSGAGKTVLADALALDLAREKKWVLRLDGDEFRNGLCRDLGFDRASRMENIRRAAYVARMATEQGLTVIASFMTPDREMRYQVQKIIGIDRMDFVWVDAPLEICRQRDPKKLYQKSNQGTVQNVSGVDAIFETPIFGTDMHCHIQTAYSPVQDCVDQLNFFCKIQLQELTK